MPDNSDFIKSIDDATLMIVNETIANMGKACLTVEKKAKELAPVDIGILRASIKSEVSFKDNEICGSVFSTLDYAPYIEFGTGVYAKEGKGRMTPWYVPAELVSKSRKKPTFKGKVTIVYGKNGKKFYKTDGIKPKPFLEPAKTNNIKKIQKLLAGMI